MSITSTAIYLSARALLNDQGTALFTNTTLEPLLQLALRDLEAAEVLEDGPLVNRYSANATVAALTTVWTGQATAIGAGNAIIFPMKMEERTVGSVLESDWVDMTFKDTLPNQVMGTTLDFWTWRIEQIVFLGATTAREVRLWYKGIIDVTPSGGVITILSPSVHNFLAFKTAEYAAATIGQNADIASAMSQYAAQKLEEILGIIDKNNQKVPIRRKGYTRKFRRIVS